MTEILSADNLATLSGVRHGFFTRAFGNGGFSGQEDPSDVPPSRERMTHALGVAPQNLLSAYQIHSPDVVTVDTIWGKQDRPEADGLVTDRPGIALGILTADCVPILFADQRAGIIGAAHAGWRGAITGVVENTLEAMEKLGGQRKHIAAALGPCIWQKSYEVGPEFPAPFMAEASDNERFFAPAFKSDHYQFDLPGYVVAKLHRLGVPSVQHSPANTYAEPERYFSHRYSTLRAEKRQGNLMSAIALVAA